MSIQPRTQIDTPVHQQHQRGRELFIDTLAAARICGYVTEDSREGYRRARHAFRAFAKRRGLTLLSRDRRWIVSELDVRAELRRRQR